MSYFAKTIVRGAGNEIGRSMARTVINKVVKGADANYVNLSSKTTNNYVGNSSNDKINYKLNTDVIEECNGQLLTAMETTEYLRTQKFTSQSPGFQWRVLLLGGLVVAPIIAGVVGYLGSLMGLEWVTAVAFIGTLSFLPTIMGMRIRNKKEAQEYYDSERKRISGLLTFYQNKIDYLKSKYGEDITLSMIKRSPMKGLPIDEFDTFFGSPNSVEQTEDTMTYVYGTSKRAGDWFRFKNGVLHTYTIK